jgi:acyl dehydratase
MFEALHFEDMEVGARWTSRARTVTEADVGNFAGLTGDYDPLHVDHEYAKQTPFGRPIGHGLLGLSLVAGLGSQCPPVRTLAFTAIRDWQFLKPIYIGDTVYAVAEVVEKQANGRRSGRVIWKRQLVNQNEQVVQEGMLETIVAVRQPKPRRRDAAAEAQPGKPHLLARSEQPADTAATPGATKDG